MQTEVNCIFFFPPLERRETTFTGLASAVVLSTGNNENSQKQEKKRVEVGPEVPLQCVPAVVTGFSVRWRLAVVSHHTWPFSRDFYFIVRAEFCS